MQEKERESTLFTEGLDLFAYINCFEDQVSKTKFKI